MNGHRVSEEWWTVPEGFAAVSEPTTGTREAVIEVKMQEFVGQQTVTEPGVLLETRRRINRMSAALPQCVLQVLDPQTGEAPVELAGVCEANGTFYRVRGRTAWDYRKNMRSFMFLKQLGGGVVPVEGEALVRVLADWEPAVGAEGLETFASEPGVKARVLAAVLAMVRQTLDGMGALGAAEWLHEAAERGAVPGFTVRTLGGGAAGYCQALAAHLEGAPVSAMLAAARI
ncbi:MAG TPA: hypothetical protein PLP31_00870 [Thermoanaerobaculaceae bacterium]|nr:hypothetical protein [Thermoanaerobaculaceae bacterium]